MCDTNGHIYCKCKLKRNATIVEYTKKNLNPVRVNPLVFFQLPSAPLFILKNVVLFPDTLLCLFVFYLYITRILFFLVDRTGWQLCWCSCTMYFYCTYTVTSCCWTGKSLLCFLPAPGFSWLDQGEGCRAGIKSGAGVLTTELPAH